MQALSVRLTTTTKSSRVCLSHSPRDGGLHPKARATEGAVLLWTNSRCFSPSWTGARRNFSTAERSQSRDWLRADRHSSASTRGAPDERNRSPSRGFDARDIERYGQRSTLSTPLLEPIMQEFRTIHFAQSLNELSLSSQSSKTLRSQIEEAERRAKTTVRSPTTLASKNPPIRRIQQSFATSLD
jgi:hypothetical protein